MRRLIALYLVGILAALGVACSSNTAPSDALGAFASDTATAATTATTTSTVADSQPIYLTTMTHMEGSWLDDVDEDVFLRHVEQLRYGMDIFDEYGAKMTVESEKPFARANTVWGLNMLQEVLDRGHGVGTHCDIGFKEDLMPVEEFAALLKENKDLVDALVGEENNRGCSGGGGVNDWVIAADLAGFDYLDGIVAMHYLSMPIEDRPSDEWTDEYIRAEAYHDNAPVDLEDRIYPFALADATDFVPDDDAILVVSSGELGRVDAQAEIAAGGTYTPSSPFTIEDVEAAVALIRDIHSWRDQSQVTKITFHFPAELFEPANEEMLRAFLEAMQDLEEEGIVQWATQGEAYDAYVAQSGKPADLDRSGIVAADTSSGTQPPAGGPSGAPPPSGTAPKPPRGSLPPAGMGAPPKPKP